MIVVGVGYKKSLLLSNQQLYTYWISNGAVIYRSVQAHMKPPSNCWLRSILNNLSYLTEGHLASE